MTWIGDMELAEDPEIRRCWDMNQETWILQRILRYKDAETWIRRCGSCRGSILVDAETWIGDMDLAEDPGIYNRCWDMNPETWFLQRILIYKDAETWIRRCGSCRGSILVDAKTWIGDMAPAEDPWDTKCTQDTDICLVNNFHAICSGGSYWEADVKDPLLMSSYTLFEVACQFRPNLNVKWKKVITVRLGKT